MRSTSGRSIWSRNWRGELGGPPVYRRRPPPRIGAEAPGRLPHPPPPRMDRVEGQRRLPRPAHPRQDHQLVARDVDVDVAEVVNPDPAQADGRIDLEIPPGHDRHPTSPSTR